MSSQSFQAADSKRVVRSPLIEQLPRIDCLDRSCRSTVPIDCLDRLHRWNAEDAEIDWPMFMGKKKEELRRLNGVYDKMLNNAGVTIIEGRGKILDAHTVEVGGTKYTVCRSRETLRHRGSGLPECV